ncbi:MAG: M15 family metallopeptidase [Bacteroidota bacterium]|nr:M15 family metallopeptidase [Bacteroidota bacterium]
MNVILTILCFLTMLQCSNTTPPPSEQAVVVENDTVPKPKDTVAIKTEEKEIFTTDYIMGQFDPAKHPAFEVIDIKYADREGLYLRKDTYKAFREMYNHALKAGIRLQIRSATRNFNYQKGIWESKWTGEKLIEGGENLAQTTPDPKARAMKILRYSSMPGSSRHHWGTDIDLNNFDNSWFAAGEGLNMYNWLKAHAAEHGFCQPYTAGRPAGYLEERWHWSYLPVSKELTELARKSLKNEMIKGFLGSETAVSIDVVKKYVLGIDEQCIH